MANVAGPSKVTISTPQGSVKEATMIGRYKSPSVSLDSVLRSTAMSTAQLASATFPPKQTDFVSVPPPVDVVPVSSASSIATRESDSGALSDFERPSSDQIERESCDKPKSTATVRSTTTSARQGRLTQRWLTDPETNETIRLVTGCVPILKGGKIMFVSANRKAEWILPKGGWEKDETMEESATRECFEEAGVSGSLGPALSQIQYETRKAKKRRLENEEILLQAKKNKGEDTKNHSKSSVPKVGSVLTQESIKRLQDDGTNKPVNDDTTSTTSSYTSNYSQVRMTLFPLYVDTVAESWPENGRLRKAVGLDEAIKIMESRPEFKAALLEVKARGLHLHPECR